jgi:threonine 3-dehydrogenase
MAITTMRALVKAKAAPGAEIQNVSLPDLRPTDVLVRVRVAAVCGTDLHIYQWDDWSQHRVRPPVIFGHEFCGYVERVGSEVSRVKPGDYVSAEMHIPCGKCYQCRTGQAHICQFVQILGVDDNGCFAEYVRIPESNIWKLDPGISPEYAAILDPLGNAVHTVLAGEIAGRSVVIVGCGPIGLMAIAVCRACGGGPIFALEPNANRRQVAEQMQADVVLDPASPDLVPAIIENTPGRGVDVALEFSGHPNGVASALTLARRGGRVSLLGIPSRKIEIDLANDVIFKGLTIQGINGRRMYETWYQMEALLREKRLNLDPLFTDRLPLSSFPQGMERLKRGEASKVLFFPNGEL